MKQLPVLLISLFTLLTCSLQSQTIYVAPGSTGNGSSWTEATGNLTSVLSTASAGTQIWVAAGIYLPDADDRDISFVIPDGVALYGGFNGTEDMLSLRDPAVNLSILSGAIGTTDSDDNSYSVIRTTNVSANTIVDGFIIENGVADSPGSLSDENSSGAGWYNLATNGQTSSPSINNCIFRNNISVGFGGGMVNIASAGSCFSLITNTVFENNTCSRDGDGDGIPDGGDGGGLYNDGRSNGACNPQILDCTFTNNLAGNGGGGIYNNGQDGTCNPVIDRCRIIGNAADYAGGGVYSFGKDGAADAQISNCLIVNNTAQFGGGGIYNLGNGTGSASPSVVNCTFTGNTSVVGGAMYNNAGDPNGTAAPNIYNCIFWNNPVSSFGSVFRANYGTPYIAYSIVDEATCQDLNSGTSSDVTCGPGMIYNLDPLLTTTYELESGSPAINMGDNVIINTLALTLDLSNNERTNNSIVDMGAFEIQAAPEDTDGDGIFNDNDNCPLIANADQLDSDDDNFGAVCECDDNDPASNPFAAEICDGVDNNCDGIIDEGFDQDGDGFKTCEGDCDDTDPAIFPGATELCDGLDNNCDGTFDEGAAPIARYPDNDNDGLGDATATASFDCPPLPGYVEDNTDCDDNNAFLPQAPGTLCDDGDPNTTGDIIQEDGCTCSGIPGLNGYCTTLGDQPWIEWIDSVGFGEIQHSSSKERYGDFTFLSTTVQAGNDYSIAIQANFSFPHYDEYIRIWIDFNQDADFEDEGEMVLEAVHPTGPDGTLPPLLDGIITIPADALAGNTRMRISMKRDAYADPCESFDFGEVEDYSLTIENNADQIVLTCPDDLTINTAPGATAAAVTWEEPALTSSCNDGPPTLTQTAGPANGSDLPVGITTITYEATDPCGNSETCSFTITVNASNATLTLNCPGNIVVDAAPGATSAIATWNDPTVSSDCANGTPSFNQTAGLPSGSSFNIGTTTITYEATDPCGNTETCSFTVTINSGGPGGNGYCESSASSPWVEWIGNVTLNDLDNISSKNGYGDFISLSTTLNIGESYPMTVLPVFSYTHYTEYIQVWIDFNQNESFSDPGELVVSAVYNNGVNGTAATPITSMVSIPAGAATGATRMRVSMQRDQSAGPCEIFNRGEVEDYTVVLNNAGPTLTLSCSENITVSTAPGGNSAMVNWSGPVTSTTCPNETVTLIQTSGPANGSIQPTGTYTISYEASDNCGNVETCSFSIIVNDASSTLTIDCPGNVVISTTPGATSAVATWTNPVVNTDCANGGPVLSQTQGLPSGSSFSIGTTTISYEATDPCGNIETCSFTVTVNSGGSAGNGYCESSANSPWVEWIGNVTINDLNNTSSKNGYGDFTSLSANLNIGESYPITVLPVFSYTHYTEYLQVWIDFNQNESFSDPGELVVSTIYSNGINGTTANPITGTVNIPAGAVAGATRMRVSMQRSQAAGPCENFARGEVEDYTVVLINSGPSLSLNCSEDISVSAGVGGSNAMISWTEPTASSTCPGGAVTLTQTSGPVNGSTQPVGTYTISYEATDNCGNTKSCSFTVTVTSLSATLNLDCPANQNLTLSGESATIIATWNEPVASTTCPGNTSPLVIQIAGPVSGSDFSAGVTTITYEATDDCGNIETCSFTITVSDSNPGVYCEARGTSPWIEWISNVTLGAINNTSSKNGYGNFTNLTTPLNQGEAYPFSVQPVFSYTQYNEYLSIYIDFNNDKDFTDAGELVHQSIFTAGAPGSTVAPFTGNITVPSTASTGTTRMRVIMKRDAYGTSCESFDRGEVEDYSVTIESAATNAIVSNENILELAVYKTARTAQVTWSSNMDITTTHYAVERRTADSGFEVLKEINPFNNTDIVSFFQYEDNTLKAGKYYYRIVAHQHDGAVVITAERMIDAGAVLPFISVFPNPAMDYIEIAAEQLVDRGGKVMITNGLGQVLIQQQISATAENSVRIATRDLEQGIYMLSLKPDGRKRMGKRFVIERK